MNLRNDGLTVGELTIGIGVLCLIAIIWSAVVKKESSAQSYLPTTNEELPMNNHASL